MKRFLSWLAGKFRARPVQVEYRVRLTEDELAKLARAVANPLVVNSTSELEAGFKLGVQYTLQVLRDGFTTRI